MEKLSRRRISPTQTALNIIKEGSLAHEEELDVRFISTYKGWGVFAKKNIEKGAFILQYRGENVSCKEGERRLLLPGVGSFLFFIGKKTCIDASRQDGKGKMINDSVERKRANCLPKLIDGHLCVFAWCDIKAGEELLYYYGETETNMYWRLEQEPECYFTPEDKEDYDRDCHENLDDSCDDPTLKMTDSDAHQVNKAASSRSQHHSPSRIIIQEDKDNFDGDCHKNLDDSCDDPTIKMTDSDAHHLNKAATTRSQHQSPSRIIIQEDKDNFDGDCHENLDDSCDDPTIKMTDSDAHQFNKAATTNFQNQSPSGIIIQEDKDNFDGDCHENLEDSCDDPTIKITDSDAHQVNKAATTNFQHQSPSGIIIQEDKDNFDGDCHENLDDSCDDPTIKMTDSDAHQVNKAASSRSQHHSPSRIIIQEDEDNFDEDCHENLSDYSDDPTIKMTDSDAHQVNKAASSRSQHQSPSRIIVQEYKDDFDGDCHENLEDSCDDPTIKMTDSDAHQVNKAASSRSQHHSPSRIIVQEVEDDFDEDYDEENLDDSFNDPDFKMTDSDVQTSDDSDQEHGNDVEYVSDSSDQSDVIPVVFPALQINKLNSSKSHQVNKAAFPRSQQHSPSHIIIQGTNNSKDKRVWDKIHFCFYCKSKFTNITKHYLGPHRNEPEVKMILDHPKKSKERSLALLKLRNAGDFQNNMTVLKNGKGTLITWARPDNESVTYKDYLPCEDCRAFFLKSNLWRHRQTCPFIVTKTKNQKVQSQAQLLIPTSEKVSSGLQENVISKMVCDEVTIAVRNDAIIVAVGEKLFRKHGHLPHLNTYVSQKMRELGRFMIKVREIDPKIISMKYLVTPENYPLAVKATRLLCQYKEYINKFSNPSLALKLGHLLKKCAKIQKSSSLIECDSEKGRKADEFLSLVESEWTDDISSSALQTLASQKMNKGDMLPISEDILKLQAYFNDRVKNITDQLENKFSKTKWDELNQITLARVVLFNRRRGGETERVTLEAYDKRQSKANILREVELALSPVERMLCSTFERIEIRGKKGRTVPVLLTPEIMKYIDLLLKWRKEANVDQNNPFLFPRPNNSLQALRTTDVLRKFAKLANLKYPNNLTSTKLRKHVATVSQILNLSKSDLEVMANFMGHDIEIHRTFYRIPQETLQVARMGKLLSAFDRGTISKYSGKSLDDITLDEDVSSEDECDDDDDMSDDEMDDLGSNLTSKRLASEMECTVLAKKARDQDMAMDSGQGTSSAINPISRKSSSCPKQARRIQHLTEEQSRCLRKLFQVNITMRRELKRIDCINASQKHQCLSSLDWTKIKNTVHNWITAEKRKIKQMSK